MHRRAGFDHVNADLIFGTPGGEPRGLAGEPGGRPGDRGSTTSSTYALQVEERTPPGVVGRQGPPAGPPTTTTRPTATSSRPSSSPPPALERYEISNWAKPGAWSRHNLCYWTGGDYLGFGAGAHGHRHGRPLVETCRRPRTYVARSPAVEEGWEELPAAERAAEAAIVGLRLAGGLDRARFAEDWGMDPVRTLGG